MFTSQVAQEFAKQFVNSLPPSLKMASQEIENQLRLFLQQGFQKMDLVTREEFDIQKQVLAKTRMKLEQMEEVLHKLEANASSASGGT